MSVDAGLMSKLEAAIVELLSAVQYNGADAFKTVDYWRHQVAAAAGGAEAFAGFAPFAFIGWARCTAKREGDYDLNQTPEIYIMLGQTSRADGGARIGETEGDNVRPGISVLRDLVIAALDSKYPAGQGLASDDIYYEGDETMVDTPRAHAITMRFSVNNITLIEE